MSPANRGPILSLGKRARQGTAMRGGGDGERERRSPYLPSGYLLDELAERDLVDPSEAGQLGGGGFQRDGGGPSGGGAEGVKGF
jgi:hypothetical protein